MADVEPTPEPTSTEKEILSNLSDIKDEIKSKTEAQIG